MKKQKKPTPAEIAKALPLTQYKNVGAHPSTYCNVCGTPSEQLGVWREHDPTDRPISGPLALVFIGKDHPECLRQMEDHPRLYAEERGDPGTFPLLCGPCVHRDGYACAHPELRANGGPGLRIHLDALAGSILCGRGGCRTPVAVALKCAGRATA